MTNRLIDIDDSLLVEAQEALGADTVMETVTQALQEAISSKRRARLSDEDLVFFAEATADLRTPEVMAAAWR